MLFDPDTGIGTMDLDERAQLELSESELAVILLWSRKEETLLKVFSPLPVKWGGGL